VLGIVIQQNVLQIGGNKAIDWGNQKIKIGHLAKLKLKERAKWKIGDGGLTM